MRSLLTLQRLRFPALDVDQIPATINTVMRRFDVNSWREKVQQGYWKATPNSVDTSRTPLQMESGSQLSSDTLVNSFFVGHWLLNTRLTNLSLWLEFEGRFFLEIFSHTQTGEAIRIETHGLNGDESREVLLPLSLPEGALRLSLTLTAESPRASLKGGAWKTSAQPDVVHLGIIIPTRDHPHSAAETVKRIRTDPDLEQSELPIVLIDMRELPSRSPFEHLDCHVYAQENLGPTAGWIRGVFKLQEQVPKITHFLVLDDELAIDSEGILRMIRVNQLSRRPTLFLGARLDICRPNRTIGLVDRFYPSDANHWKVGPYLDNLDISQNNSLNALSIPFSSACRVHKYATLPASLFTKIGFPFPLFEGGYEDAEYAVRARKQEIPTRVMPGVGVWHYPAYLRKRAPEDRSEAILTYSETYGALVHNALHGITPCRSLFSTSWTSAVSDLQGERYRDAAAKTQALEDFLGGWAFFHTITYPKSLTRVESDLKRYEDPNLLHDFGQELKQRLEQVALRFKTEVIPVQREFETQLPLTFDAQAWKKFFHPYPLIAL